MYETFQDDSDLWDIYFNEFLQEQIPIDALAVLKQFFLISDLNDRFLEK